MTEESGSEIAQEQLYLPRSGEDIEGYLEILAAAPDRPLDEHEREALLDYEQQLIKGELLVNDREPIRAVRAERKELPEVIKGFKYGTKKHEITADFLLTEAGKELLDQGGLKTEFEDALAAARYIRANALSIPHDTLIKLAKQSEAYAVTTVTQALVKGVDMQDPVRVHVFEDASNLLLRTASLLSYRNFLKQAYVQKISEDNGTNLAQAELAVAEIYRKYVNAELAKVYPDLMHLWAQAEEMSPQQKEIIQGAITHIHTPLATLGRRFVSMDAPSSIVRLDRLRNGASLSENGYTPVSGELGRIFEETPETVEAQKEPLFSAEEIAVLDTIRYDAEQLKRFCELMLAHFGKLSDIPEENYDPDRPVRAADGNWQVVITDKTSSLDVVDPPGYVRIPANFNRTLTAMSPAGVIPVVAHELAHVFQKDNQRAGTALALTKELGGGKRNSVMQEAGSIVIERIVQRRLFGRNRTDNPHYARAMEAVDAGEGELAATRIFFESYHAANPGETAEKAAEIAISRTKRLIRRHGGYDSQALNYAETALLAAKAEVLPQEVQAVLFAEGAYDIADFSQLHRFGLVSPNPETFPTEQYIAIVTDVFRKIIQEAAQN